ncbi:enoyl-CoA hydratase/isomerase family protein [Saccharolobus islandicus]|uniref:Enoyl-CoA hydratase/isomerase n=1 Tax=Saccharolobus islandicus (strain M.16.27) TaxID=427318 RepID=C3N498_SACI3|nr:enoyl-CoA hydratase/isomerase family protein [Sulfolobus islandicus]ACP54823.1 Enoyl-CoA hydratase/isomerase [Sulfolobus islandicus M.16.27]
MNSNEVMCETKDNVMWISINRPEKLNALNTNVRLSIIKCLKEAEANQEVRVIVIKGVGKVFSAGGDISDLRALSELSEEEIIKIRKDTGVSSIGSVIRNLSKPVIALVHGYCLGGGFELIQFCDLVYATEDAIFGQPEINIGIIPGGGGTQNLPRLIGEKKAKELIFTGKRISAKETFELGIINNIFHDLNDMENEVLKIINEIKAKSPKAIAAAKRAINITYEKPLSEGLKIERKLLAKVLKTNEAKQLMDSFIKKSK